MSDKKMPLSVDRRGVVQTGGLHDAVLESFFYTRGLQARFDFVSTSGVKSELVFKNPMLMNINSLWEGVTLGSIFFWKVSDVPDVIWDEDDNGWNALFYQRYPPEERRKEAQRLMKLHPTSYLVVVSCSFGGNWASLVDEAYIVRL